MQSLLVPANAVRRWGLVALAAAGAAGILTALLPGPAIQVGVALGVVALLASALMARAGHVLDPAWVMVVTLYLIGPVGSLLLQAGLGLSMAAVAALVPAPFVAAALATRPAARGQLILLAPLCLLLGWAALSLLWSTAPAYGLDKLGLALVTGFLPAAYVLVLAAASRRIGWALVAAAALFSAIGLLAFGAASPLYPGRPTLFDANPIWAARALFLGALVALFGPFPALARLAVVPIMVVAGLATVSLGPALGFVVAMWAGVAETLRCSGHASRRLAVTWVAVGIGLIVLVAAVQTGALGAVPGPLAAVINDPNVSSRAGYLGAATTMFLGSPVIGMGLGGFAANGLDTYPHNMVAEIAAELGLLGLLAFLAWVGLAVRGAMGSPLLVALVVGTGTFALFSGSVASNAEFWLCTGLAVAAYPLARRSPTAMVHTQPHA